MAARHYDDHVVGLGSSGIWGGAAWRADITATFLDDGQGQNTQKIPLLPNEMVIYESLDRVTSFHEII